jgi:hypothetical protein
MEGTVSRGAIAACYAYSLLCAAVMGHFLLGVPIQISDSLSNILSVRTGWDQFFAQGFSADAYLRPLLWADLKIVFDASRGDYTTWYRGVHVAQVIAAAVLTVGVIAPRRWRDAATLPLGLGALFGIHTFKGTIVEAFPVNTFLTIVLCCLAAANLALSVRSRWWTDAAGILLFVAAALTVESGLLVWVIFVGAALVGARGMSRPALALLTALLAGYFVLRFGVLGTGAPALVERSSGFGFAVLDPPDLIVRFGERAYLFYAYNVATSFVSVLFSEPRAGVFRLVRAITTGSVAPAYLIAVAASTMGTMVIVADVWNRRHAWLRFDFDRDDRVVALFWMVLAANAVISYPYTKDVIMSAAGVFYAAALAVAARRWLSAAADRPGMARAAVAAMGCLLLGASWALLTVNAHLNLRVAAFKERNDWAYEASKMARSGAVLPPDNRRIFEQLRGDAVRGPLPPVLWLQDVRIFDVD